MLTATLLGACTRASSEGVEARSRDAGVPRPARAPATARELAWRFEHGPFGGMDVAVLVPGSPDPGSRYPVLVAFHGRGESFKGSRRGARAWLDDYQLPRAVGRLEHPPLNSDDFERSVSEARLDEINAALHAQPYAGVIVVCPFLPDVLRGAAAWAEGEALASFVVDTLLPRVYAKTPALSSAAATGVDGVSLGGRAALLVGLARPRAFGAVGALQPAMDAAEVERFAELGRRALAQNARLRLRVLSSDEDYFLAAHRALSEALAERGVPHSLRVARGTHGYAFNRGPGALEMLLFHSRALRGLAPP